MPQKGTSRLFRQETSYGGGEGNASFSKPPPPFSEYGFSVPEKFTLSLELEMVPKSLNRKLRRNRFVNDRENKTWDSYLGWECHGKKPPAPLRKAKLIIVRHSHRMLDFDGLVGSLKPVADALVLAGVIADDSWNVLGAWEVGQVFRPAKLGPLLTIQVLEA